jgi:cytidine deaminase
MSWNEISFENLSKNNQNLIKAAIDVAKNAYNIYSQFYVGAAVITKSGNIYSSCNMENASYGVSICAEPGCIQSAISAGDPEIITIAVAGGRRDETTHEITTPCGRCRQIIFECSQISKSNINIICTDLTLSKIIQTDIETLLPYAFGPDNLKMSFEIEQYKKSINR